MRWLKSTTQKSWVLGAAGKQFIVPQCDTRDNKWLVIEEEDFAQVMNQPVVKSLIKAGAITVLDKEPAEIRNSVPNLQVANTTLKAELDTVKAERDALRTRVQELEKILFVDAILLANLNTSRNRLADSMVKQSVILGVDRC